jgi:hypothetical protein
MKVYRCQFCKYSVAVNKNDKGTKSAKYKMGNHYETQHKSMIPPDMTGYRFFYYLLTKKSKGSCVICHNETDFNENTMKYSRFCNNPACKQKYKEERDKRMIDKYGKVHLLDDPEIQKKMQQGRRIAGVYTWSNGKDKFNYLSSYELDFLKYLDEQLHWVPSDIIAPSPHIYTYEYKEKSHYYMPDFFIPSMNLEVEIKDDGSAKNINQESREKDVIKDNLLKSLSNIVNYIKIVNKDYTKFIELVKEE